MCMKKRCAGCALRLLRLHQLGAARSGNSCEANEGDAVTTKKKCESTKRARTTQ